MLDNNHAKVKDLTTTYDIFFVDLWGVIHDGIATYDGVQNTLQQLKAANKTVIFISNAPRRKIKAEEVLHRLGISSDLYSDLITSGEVVYEMLLADKFKTYGKKFFNLGPKRDDGLMEGSDYQRVETIKEADFIIATGFDNDNSTLDEQLPLLEQATQLSLPLICANPDLLVVRKDGSQALCAGVSAAKYQEMGGKVSYFGKPYQEIYQAALKLINNSNKAKIAAIGDSLITDIKGANDFGIDAFFIPGGIYGSELKITHGQMPGQGNLNNLYQKYNIFPHAALAEFKW